MRQHHAGMRRSDTYIAAPGWRTGMHAGLPLALGVAAYGLVWGALAGQAGLSTPEASLMSAAVFAGAAQFVALGFWQGHPHGLPLGAVVVTTLIVNLRFVLMSASMQPLFEREQVRGRWLKAFFISDENWALTSAEAAHGRGSVGFLLGAGALIYAAWVAASIAGRVAGDWIGDPQRFGLDFAFTASFLALLLGMWRGRQTLLPWAVAAVVAVVAHAWLPGKWYIVIGGLCGSIVALPRSRAATRP
jgi:4-azaleucine resistance transporter AzlC